MQYNTPQGGRLMRRLTVVVEGFIATVLVAAAIWANRAGRRDVRAENDFAVTGVQQLQHYSLTQTACTHTQRTIREYERVRVRRQRVGWCVQRPV